jgi:hypothetical protein
MSVHIAYNSLFPEELLMASYSDFASLYFMFLTVIYSPEKDHKKRV